MAEQKTIGQIAEDAWRENVAKIEAGEPTAPCWEAAASDVWDQAVEACADRIEKLRDNTQQLKLHMGEMEAQELRTLKAGMGLFASLLRSLKRSDKTAPTMDKLTIKDIEELVQQLSCTDPQHDCEADIRSILARAASALRHLLNERKMKPMETAPTGTPVLLYGRLTGEIHGDFEQDEFFVGTNRHGSSWTVDGTDYYTVGCDNPKGWLPLPPSPEESDDA